MKQYLLDPGVLLDLLLNRPPWAADAAILWDAHRQSQIRIYLAAFSLPTVFYIVRKQAGIAAARTSVQALSGDDGHRSYGSDNLARGTDARRRRF